jgi:7,8-didemethyl-8-hydroxy-5-deazariboflavin synthase CofH subunit
MSQLEAMFEFDDAGERLEQLLPDIEPRVASILERAVSGHEVTHTEGLVLSEVMGHELAALAAAADLLRQAKVGDTVTYVVCRNINFTNVCYVGCKFCAFHSGPNKPESWDHSLEEVGRRAEDAWNRGATEICMQGGLPRNMTPYYYRDLLQAIRKQVPGIHIHAYSPMEITYGVELTKMPMDEYLMMLRDNGLNSVPGTAAEILDDEVRMVLSKNKVSTEQWIRVIKTAHEVGIFTTSTMMYGHRENGRHWVNHMLLLRDIQKQTGGITEFVPLGFVHENTALFQQGLARPGPTEEEDIRVHALARVLLNDTIPNVQVSWVKMGRRMSQLCLRAGANDFGGTLMEESISRLAGSTEGQMIWPYEFRNLIRQIDRVPAERSTTYEILRRWGDRADSSVGEPIAPAEVAAQPVLG